MTEEKFDSYLTKRNNVGNFLAQVLGRTLHPSLRYEHEKHKYAS